MIWGIIGALDAEVALIREQMRVEKTVQVYGSDYTVGSYSGHHIVVVCCSIGKVNAALCASVIIREFGATAVVNIGIAGAMGAELKVLDVVLSERVAFHDINLEIFGRYYPNKTAFEADPKLLAACARVLEGMPDRAFSYQKGLIATGDVFVDSKAVKEDIAARLAPLCVEMEGAAIGQAAHMNGVPFLVIRTMSDNADDDAKGSYDNFIELAAKNSARIVLELVRAAG